MTANEQRTIDVRVHNLGGVTWDWGAEGEPAVRLAATWRTLDGRPVDTPALRTHFPAPIRPGESDLVPTHILAPAEPGRYRVEVDLVHEHVRWLGCAISFDVDVAPERRVTVVGDDEVIEQTAEALALDPAIEVLVSVQGEALPVLRYGYRRFPGLRTYLLADGLRVFPVRAARLVRSAQRIRSGRREWPLPQGAGAFLAETARCERLVLAGRDMPADAPPTRELARLVVTALAARTLGVPVAVHEDLFEGWKGVVDRSLARALRCLAERVYREPSELLER